MTLRRDANARYFRDSREEAAPYPGDPAAARHADLIGPAAAAPLLLRRAVSLVPAGERLGLS